MTITLEEFRSRYDIKETTIGGTLWRYRVTGDGAAILLLHGMAGNADIWFQQIDALSATRKVVAVTYPRVNTLAALAAGIDGVLTAEGVETYTVVGSSLGGYLAQYLVATESHRVTAAVFANTFPPNPVIAKRSKNLVTLAGVLPPSFVRAFLARNVERMLVPAGDGSPLLHRLLMEQFDEPGFKEAFLDRYRCVIYPFEPTQPSIPVSLISANNDPLVPQELSKVLCETYPDATTYEFDGGGHFPYVNRPDEYTSILERFLSQAGI
ncbi:hypothetical protein MNBD_ACTINO01-50 [hydrothermal vent metagenome]|uniref:Maspardin n=1 Tax=hydrothermal vent metagenome TaxID=652676 RepID=A0A3B0RMS8_9ZZZZ